MPECGEGLGMPWLRCFSAGRGIRPGGKGAEIWISVSGKEWGASLFLLAKSMDSGQGFHLRNDSGNSGNEVF